MATVASGAAGAQAITIAFTPVITRLYGPEAFGMLGAFMAVLAVLTPITALAYPIAIVLPKSDQDARTLTRLSAILALAVAALAAIILLMAEDLIAQLVNLGGAVGMLLILLPVAMMAGAFHQIFTHWLIRKKQFKITARVAVLQSLSVNIAKTGLGWAHPSGVILITIATVSLVFHALLLWIGILRVPAAHPNKNEVPTNNAFGIANLYRDFPLYRAPQILLNAVSQSIPVILLAAYFGPASAGYLALTRSVLAAPVTLIGNSVGTVFYPKAVDLYSDRAELKGFLIKTTLGLFFLGCLVFVPVMLFGPWMFSMIFGVAWEVAGQFGRWVALWILFSLSARPLISIIPVIGLQKWFLIFECCFMPVKIAALCLGALTDSAVMSVALYSIVSAVFYLALYFYVLRRV